MGGEEQIAARVPGQTHLVPLPHLSPNKATDAGGWEPCSLWVYWMGIMVYVEAFANFLTSYKIMVNFC